MAEISLARDFPLSSEADWQALVKEALKGAPLSSLGTTSYDGIGIEPSLLCLISARASATEG